MPKPMPEQLDILGIPFRLKTAGSSALDQGTMGLYVPWKSKILLDKSLPPMRARATAVHEVVHAIDEMTKVDMSERDVTAFSSALFQFLRANPVFVEWIMSEEDATE